MEPVKTAVQVNDGLRHTLVIGRPKKGRFIIVFEWVIICLGLDPLLTIVYCALLSLKAARLPMRVEDIACFAQRSPRSVRRALAKLERGKLIVRQPRYGGGKRLANEYVFLWHTSAPLELRGAPYAAGVSVPVATAGSDTVSSRASGTMSPVADQIKSAEEIKEQAGSSGPSVVNSLPSEVRQTLEQAAPGQAEACFRVLRESCKSLDAAEARRVWLIALKKLIHRCERGEVTNPPGLLRSCLVAEAIAEAPALSESCARLRRAIEREDELVLSARSGFEAIRRMRKRASDVRSYFEQHAAVFGTFPEEPVMLCAVNPDIAELLNEVARLLELVRVARDRGDSLAVDRAEAGLLRLEHKLDEHIRNQRVTLS